MTCLRFQVIGNLRLVLTCFVCLDHLQIHYFYMFNISELTVAMDAELQFALRKVKSQDVVRGTTYAKSPGNVLELYKNGLKVNLQNEEMMTHGFYQGQSEAGDKIKKQQTKVIICIQDEQNDVGIHAAPNDGRSAVLETGPGSTNGM